jgi:phosphopantothenoylcysteine decarboxylase
MNILLGVTGSVAASLTPKLVEALKEVGTVRVVYTDKGAVMAPDPNGVRIQRWGVGNDEVIGAMDVDVYFDNFEWPGKGFKWQKGKPVLHIDLRAWADILVIAPLTANTLAKIANGQADNLLTNIVRAWQVRKPLVVAPAMNTSMWDNPFTKRHLETLWEVYKVKVVQPQSKVLACGDEGIGAMADIDEILQVVRIEKSYQEYLSQ